MKVKYLDHMGSDLTVVNAARVSFNKKSEWDFVDWGDKGKQYLKPSDKKLINYLAKHNHFTPFAHPQITLHVKVPIFVARQLHKHQVGFVVNEVSRRYVDEEPEVYLPTAWRQKAENKKQGSGEEVEDSKYWSDMALTCFVEANEIYLDMLHEGVCPEQARMVLPLSTYTEFWMTGSLAAWVRLYNLRIQPDAQKEVQEVARQIGEIVSPLFPVSWEALVGR